MKAVAEKLGLVVVRDEGQLNAWVDAALAANEAAANDVRSGKMAAIGRIVGAVMKLSGGKVDAKSVNEAIPKKLQAVGCAALTQPILQLLDLLSS